MAAAPRIASRDHDAHLVGWLRNGRASGNHITVVRILGAAPPHGDGKAMRIEQLG